MIFQIHRIKGHQPLVPGRHTVIRPIPPGISGFQANHTTVVLEIGENQKGKGIKAEVRGNKVVAEFEVTNQESS